MKKYIESLLLMIQFMTRIPVKCSLPCEREDFRRGTVFFPIIGLIVGLIQWIVCITFVNFLPPLIVSTLTVLTSVLVTGGLHIDGLGDTCDGFFAFKGRDRIIEIMKDSRIGTYACIAIIFDIALKIFSIYCIITRELFLFIILAPVLSRMSLVILFFTGKNAKEKGSGNLFIGNIGKVQLAAALLLALVMAAAFGGAVKGSISLAAISVLALVFNKYCDRKIGGLTGDTLGAVNEISEIVCLLIAAGQI